MAKRSTILKNWPKYLMQWGVLAALVAFMTGLIPPVSTAFPDFSCSTGKWLQAIAGPAILVAVLLLSRLFCGYLCPLGTVQDLLVKFRTRIRMKSIKVRNGSAADKALRIMKYALLFWIYYMTVQVSGLFCGDAGISHAAVTGLPEEPVLWISVASAILLVIGCIAIDMFWCRYICPLGAISNSFRFWLWIAGLSGAYIIAVLLGADIPWFYLPGAFCIMGYLLEIFHARPKLQIFHITKNEIPCNNCGACVRSCPYHIELREFHNGKVNHVDCTLCCECVAACPSGALTVGSQSPTRKKIWRAVPVLLAILLAVLMISALFFIR